MFCIHVNAQSFNQCLKQGEFLEETQRDFLNLHQDYFSLGQASYISIVETVWGVVGHNSIEDEEESENEDD